MQLIRFGPFTLDTANCRLLRNGADLRLRPQAVRVLRSLLQHAGRTVDCENLRKEAWGIYVSRHNVSLTVCEARKALAEYGRWIGHRQNVGYWLKVPRSDEQIRTGWHVSERLTREGLEKALACFQRAALEDSPDCRIHEGISRVHLMLGLYGAQPPCEAYPQFLEAQRVAIALHGLTPQLRADRAHALHIFEGRSADAEAELLQAEREEPNANICINLALLYAVSRRFEEALHALDRARSLDRLWPTLPATEMFVWLSRRDFSSALASGKEGIALQPYLHLSRSHYAQALEFSGRIDEALAEYRVAQTLAPDLPWLRALEAGCLARNGKVAEASAILEELAFTRTTEYVDPYYFVPLLYALGRRKEAFEELERAYRENSTALYILDVDPKMGALRSDRRFKRICYVSSRGRWSGSHRPTVIHMEEKQMDEASARHSGAVADHGCR